MDLGIAGRWATICASSRGPGRACAEALASEGVNVIVTGSESESEAVEQAAAQIAAAHGVQARPMIADLTTQAGHDRLLAAWPDPDIMVTSNAWLQPGGLPEVSDDDLTVAWRMYHIERHYWAPAALVQAVVAGMRSRRFGRIVNITSVAGAARPPTLTASADRQAGLSAVLKGLAAQVVGDNVTINQLVTERGMPGGVPAWGRVRHNEELAAACAILCSVHASHISGVDLQVSANHRSLALVV